MKILFYQPYNQVVVYIESVAEAFVKQGHEVLLLSHAEKGETHRRFELFGSRTFSLTLPKKNFYNRWKRIMMLARFCDKHTIDIVYSHFQEANIIAVFAQYFCKARFVITRHHSDCAFLDNNRKEQIADVVINRLARTYIAPSMKVYEQITSVERTPRAKVRLIPYGYNFAAFDSVDSVRVNEIRLQYPADLLLVKAARFIPEKRHDLLFETIKRINQTGLRVRVLLLGQGPLENQYKSQIVSHGLADDIVMVGFKLNIMDYYAAADLVVHLSLSEASNSAIKEAALAGTSVAVCRDVGDFGDYIVDKWNGFLLDKSNPSEDLYNVLLEALQPGSLQQLSVMGERLRTEVLSRFDVHNVMDEYEAINKGEIR